MKIAIHQPNFFPHYAFFQKMEEADLFVMMGYCQFEKGGWQNRFSYGSWYTMSVFQGLKSIVEKKYASPEEDWIRIKHDLPACAPLLKKFDSCITDSLFE